MGRIFCLEDLVGKGPRGSECIDLVKKHCEKVIRGNWDVFIQDKADNQKLRLIREDNWHFRSLIESRQKVHTYK